MWLLNALLKYRHLVDDICRLLLFGGQLAKSWYRPSLITIRWLLFWCEWMANWRHILARDFPMVFSFATARRSPKSLRSVLNRVGLLLKIRVGCQRLSDCSVRLPGLAEEPYMNTPPLTLICWPVMKSPSATRKSTALAISSG